MTKFTGVMPALVTPLTDDENVNFEALEKLIKIHLSQNADGFYVAGATGEGISLRTNVRKELAEAAVKYAGCKPCIVHIASTVFPEAIELAKHAEKCGAAAISAIPPLFFGYSEDDVFNYYKALAESVHIPLIMYYNPAAGFKVNSEFAARCFEVDNITGIKWTSPDYYGMIRLKDITNGEMNIINGPDEMLLMGLNAGADAGIGTTYNIILPKIRRVYDSFRSGSIADAQAAQYEVDRIVAKLLKFPLLSGIKHILTVNGIPAGNAAFPLPVLSENDKAALIASLADEKIEL